MKVMEFGSCRTHCFMQNNVCQKNGGWGISAMIANYGAASNNDLQDNFAGGIDADGTGFTTAPGNRQ